MVVRACGVCVFISQVAFRVFNLDDRAAIQEGYVWGIVRLWEVSRVDSYGPVRLFGFFGQAVVFSPPGPVAVGLVPEARCSQGRLSIVTLYVIYGVDGSLRVNFRNDVVEASQRSVAGRLYYVVGVSSNRQVVVVPARHGGVSPVVYGVRFFLCMVRFFYFPATEVHGVGRVGADRDEVDPHRVVHVASIYLVPPTYAVQVRPVRFVVVLSVGRPFSNRLPRIVRRYHHVFDYSHVGRRRSNFYRRIPSQECTERSTCCGGGVCSGSFRWWSV